MNREEIIQAIEKERADQLKDHPFQSDWLHTPSDWVAILSRHVGLSINDGAKVDLERFKRQMLRVAALSIAAFEAIQAQQAMAPREKIAGKHDVTGTGW